VCVGTNERTRVWFCLVYDGMEWNGLDSFIHSHLLGGGKYSNVRFVVCKSGFRFGLGGGPTNYSS